MKDGWIDVKDRLPEPDVNVLVAVKDKVYAEDGSLVEALTIRMACLEYFQGELEWSPAFCCCCEFSSDENVKYWMELPQIENKKIENANR